MSLDITRSGLLQYKICVFSLGELIKKSDGSPNQSMTRDIEDKVDDFVPTAEFSPVIALPDIVEVVTGEEGETILFQERAKLLRFDSDTKQWKERGIGQMKVRLLN